MQTNLEIFEAVVDAVNRKDVPEIRRLTDPQIAFIPMRAAVTGAYLGHTGIDDFLAENEERFDLFHTELDELRELPGDRLLCVGHIRVRGRGSDAETRYPTAGIAVFRDGVITSWRDYGTRAAALDAAGEL